MKKIITSLMLFTALLSLAYTQETRPRIYLQVPDVTKDDIQLNTIADTIFDTTRLILNQINKYEISTNGYITVNNIPGYCGAENIDNFISGTCDVLDNGSYEISLYTYDREQDKITVEKKETAESALEVFDIVDSIVLELLSDFSGRHIAFGNLQIVNTGNQGTYSFTLDGKSYAGNEEVLENLLIGEHDLKVEQLRMDGLCTVEEQTIVIEEDKTLVEDISIPEILDSEKEKLGVEELFISENRDKSRKKKDVDAAYHRMLALMDDTSYSAAMGDYKQRIWQDYQDWLGSEIAEGAEATEEDSVVLEEEKAPKKKRNLDRFFNVYVPVEFMGGNYVSSGLGFSLFHRKLDMKILGGFSSYNMGDSDAFDDSVDADESTTTWSVGVELEHHPMKRRFGLYYGAFYRYINFENATIGITGYETDNDPKSWMGLTAGLEYTTKGKGLTFYGNTRMIEEDFSFEQPIWTFALGAKLWF